MSVQGWTITRVHEGWSGSEIYTLLQAFRAHVIEYIYGSDGVFAASVHAQFPGAERSFFLSVFVVGAVSANATRPLWQLGGSIACRCSLCYDKAGGVITEMTRSLMSQFALAMDTKAFRSDGTRRRYVQDIDTHAHGAVLDDDFRCYARIAALDIGGGQIILVHEHLYETTLNLAENRSGGVWRPDELSRFFKKIKQYRDLLLRNPDIFFSRVQIWGKSVTESRSKFYALRDLYEREKKADKKHCRSDMEEMRFKVLEEFFHRVLPAPREKAATVFAKMSNLWSPNDLDVLLQFLVKITLDVQEKGGSDLVGVVASTLNRTEQSLVGKLLDMRKVYLRKSSYSRAAHLPDVIFDADSVAHKIFEADWSDPTDPYALGFLALKSNSNVVFAKRIKDRRHRGQVSLVGTRKKRRVANTSQRKDAESPDSTNKATTKSSESPTAVAAPEVVYTDFIREAAGKNRWSEEVTHSVCTAMNRSMDLYRRRKLKAFFEAVVQSTPGSKLTEIVFNGQALLRLFEQRHGSLDAFEEVALGVAVATSNAPTSGNLPDTATMHRNQVCTAPGAAEAATATGGESAECVRDGPTASPFDLTSSPLSVSDPENDSSLDDDPVDVDADGDDELESLSPDNESSSASSFKPSKAYPSGKSYGKSDQVTEKVCESCSKKKQAYRKRLCDLDGDDTDDGEEEEAQQDNSPWNSLIGTLDARIAELEVRKRDLVERKEERERRQRKVKWRSDIRIEVLSLMQGACE